MRYSRFERQIGAWLLAFVPLAACAESEATSEQSAPIVNGTTQTVTSQGVLRLITSACSATLLDNQWALTAAHCGPHVGDTASMGTQSQTIARVVNHPDVASGVDVALVQLSSPMTMNGSTTGFRRLLRRSVAPQGSSVRCFGYGRSDNTAGTDATLRMAVLSVGGGANNEYIFLPNASGQAAAPGDAGGPCYDDDGYAISVLRSFTGSGSPSPGETFAVTSSLYVDWADDVLAGFTLDFGTLVQNYAGLSFGLPSTWEPIQGDFDGDGKTDYARIGATGAWLFYSNGDGTFTPPSFQTYEDPPALNFGQPSTDWQTITGDFNGDGRMDYARVGASGAWMFLGQPAPGRGFVRTFQAYQAPVPTLSPAWRAITGDFDGDGQTDYARLGNTDAWIFLASNGFAGIEQTYPAPVVGFGLPSSWEPITGDFNGDGKTDYARIGSTGAWTYMSTGHGSFAQGFQAYPTGVSFGQPSSWQTITGDFNGDHKTDYARLGDTNAWIFLGTGNGNGIGFSAVPEAYQSPIVGFGLPSSWQPITGDFNGDGKTDYARLGDTGAWLFFGNGNGNGSNPFNQGFQSYDGLSFGAPSAWQVITGNFRGNGQIGYARLGDASSYIFVHR